MDEVLDVEGSVEGRLNLGPGPPHQAGRPRRRRDPDQARYSDSSIDRLVEAGVWSDDNKWVSVDWGSWLDSRAYVERTGDVEWEGWSEVLDVERALTALRNRGGEHAEAALAVTAMMLGWDYEEITEAFRQMARDTKSSERAARRAELAIESGKRFMASWLSGRSGEGAFRSYRRHYGRER